MTSQNTGQHPSFARMDDKNGDVHFQTVFAENFVVTTGGTTDLALSQLSDVDLTSTPPGDRDTLIFVDADDEWVPTPLPETLAQLTDVDVSGAVNGDVLTFNTGSWEPSTPINYTGPTDFTPSISYGTGTSLGDSAVFAKYFTINNTVYANMQISVNLTSSLGLLATREFTFTLPTAKTSNFSGTQNAFVGVSAGETNPNDTNYPQFHQLGGRTVNGTKTMAISMSYTSNTARNLRFAISFVYDTS